MHDAPAPLPVNTTQSAQWHTVTSTVTASAMPSPTPNPEDNGGKPADNVHDKAPSKKCVERGRYSDEKLCNTWCVVPGIRRGLVLSFRIRTCGGARPAEASTVRVVETLLPRMPLRS